MAEIPPIVQRNIRKLRREGKTKVQIAKQLGVCRDTVTKYAEQVDTDIQRDEAIEELGVNPGVVVLLGQLMCKVECPNCHAVVPILQTMGVARCPTCWISFQLPSKTQA
jgi:orotate phosphoribosyltransferase-like protein